VHEQPVVVAEGVAVGLLDGAADRGADVLPLCLFPFMIVLDALSGRSAVTQFSRRLGLNQQAATDVGHLFGPASSTTAAVTGASYVFFILAGIAAATALQGLYEAAFDVAPRGIKDTPRRFVWLGVLVGASLLASWVGPHLRSSAGPVALGVVGLIGLTLFWWLTMWILVGGRVSWRELFPCAMATGVFWLGMEIVFSFTFSGIVTSDQQKYGAIGVVFGLIVMADRDRGRRHPWCRGGRGVARTPFIACRSAQTRRGGLITGRSRVNGSNGSLGWLAIDACGGNTTARCAGHAGRSWTAVAALLGPASLRRWGAPVL
jgi:hypothetical protein